MDKDSFIENINELTNIAYKALNVKDYNFSINEMHLYIVIINEYFDQNFNSKDWINSNINDENLVFNLKNGSKLFYIKKEDLKVEDPTVYQMSTGGVFFKAYNSLSIFILIELGLWLYQNQSNHKLLYIENRFELTQYFKFEKYIVQCKDNIALDMIYANNDSIIISIFKDKHRYFMFNEGSVFVEKSKQLKQLYQLYNPKPKGKKVLLDTKVISSPLVSEGKLYGKFTFGNQKIDGEIDFDFEKDEKSVLEKYVTDVSNILKTLEKNNFIESIKVQITKEITNSAFTQSDYQPNEKDYLELKKDLELTKIVYFIEGYSLEFKAKKICKDSIINVQCSLENNAEEITIE
nr:hypothetical protein [Flavobacterium sp. ASV13]